MTGLVMTKTKTQRGLMEPITHIGKPHSIRVETGLPAQRDASYRYTWDRSLFLIYRRKELQKIMAEMDFSQQDIDGLEVVGKGQPFSAVTVEDYTVFERSQGSSSEETTYLLKSSPATTKKASVNAELLPRFRSPISEPQVPQPENEALRESGSQKARVGTKSPQQKSIVEEILVEESPDVDSARSPWEPDGLPLLEWNLCLEDFRKNGAHDPARQ
uniref:MYCBP associated protein n=1 Tax=Mandrillus leucophaeus TaxID=9568 RepID=A0A2K5XSL1_MANLE